MRAKRHLASLQLLVLVSTRQYDGQFFTKAGKLAPKRHKLEPQLEVHKAGRKARVVTVLSFMTLNKRRQYSICRKESDSENKAAFPLFIFQRKRFFPKHFP